MVLLATCWICAQAQMFTWLPFECSGLLIAVQKEYFTVVNYKELHFNDCSDRGAQLLHVELAFPFSQCQNSDVRHEILIVNTHLMFPHDPSLCLVRLHQVCENLVWYLNTTFCYLWHLTLYFKILLLCRSTSYFNISNLIRMSTNLSLCRSYYAGKHITLNLVCLDYQWKNWFLLTLILK